MINQNQNNFKQKTKTKSPQIPTSDSVYVGQGKESIEDTISFTITNTNTPSHYVQTPSHCGFTPPHQINKGQHAKSASKLNSNQVDVTELDDIFKTPGKQKERIQRQEKESSNMSFGRRSPEKLNDIYDDIYTKPKHIKINETSLGKQEEIQTKAKSKRTSPNKEEVYSQDSSEDFSSAIARDLHADVYSNEKSAKKGVSQKPNIPKPILQQEQRSNSAFTDRSLEEEETFRNQKQLNHSHSGKKLERDFDGGSQPTVIVYRETGSQCMQLDFSLLDHKSNQ